jgi:hypothetical protein
MWDGRLESPAAERNKEPILEVLRRALPAAGSVLEIASGSGQHVMHFARALPQLTWQPSDADPQARASVAAWSAAERLPNVRAPLDLDVRARPWPLAACDAIVCINMIHISPWAATEALFAGASDILPQGVVYLYGPYRVNGAHTAPSNAAFDRSLRAQDAAWGVRDLADVVAVARSQGFALVETIPMPANNLSVVFSRGGGTHSPSP